MINWEPLQNDHHVQEAVDKSHDQPVMIFKHSTACGVSFSALDGLTNAWDAEKVGNLGTYMMDVISDRQYARDIGSRFGIPHASPQVLILKEGEVVYNQSHFAIKFSEVEEIITKLND